MIGFLILLLFIILFVFIIVFRNGVDGLLRFVFPSLLIVSFILFVVFFIGFLRLFHLLILLIGFVVLFDLLIVRIFIGRFGVPLVNELYCLETGGLKLFHLDELLLSGRHRHEVGCWQVVGLRHPSDELGLSLLLLVYHMALRLLHETLKIVQVVLKDVLDAL